MPYVTSVEQLAKAEGKAEGKAGVILSVLERNCGSLPQEWEDRIRALSLDELERLQERMFDFQSATEVAAWLDSYSENSQQ